jgi:hypothetical protein
MPRFRVGDYVQLHDELRGPYQGFVGLVISVKPNEEHRALDRYLVSFSGAAVIEAWDAELTTSVIHDRSRIRGHAA